MNYIYDNGEFWLRSRRLEILCKDSPKKLLQAAITSEAPGGDVCIFFPVLSALFSSPIYD